MTKKGYGDIIKKPLSDGQIKKYLPNVPVILYEEMEKLNSIDELLPKDKSYCIFLYEWAPQTGHWVALLRYNDTIEYFDPYGAPPDLPLEDNGFELNQKLGQYDHYLTKLLEKTSHKVIFNKRDFQAEHEDINTCGRHCIFRILMNKDYNLDLPEYDKLIDELEKKYKLNPDQVVSKFIYLT